MRFYLEQFKWYRKLKGGTWYMVDTHLQMSPFWCKADRMPKCCGAHVLHVQIFGGKK